MFLEPNMYAFISHDFFHVLHTCSASLRNSVNIICSHVLRTCSASLCNSVNMYAFWICLIFLHAPPFGQVFIWLPLFYANRLEESPTSSPNSLPLFAILIGVKTCFRSYISFAVSTHPGHHFYIHFYL